MKHLPQPSDTALLSALAIVCITIIQITALIQGIDGAGMTAAGSAIAGLAGYQIAKRRKSVQPPTNQKGGTQ